MTYAVSESIGQPAYLGSLGSLSQANLVTVGGASANTKGVWNEIIASTVDDYSYLVVTGQGVVSNRVLADVAIGAIGSEIVIINNLETFRQGASRGGNISYMLPVKVPKGSRISMRGQRPEVGSQTVSFSVHGISGRATTSLVETYGVVPSLTLGTEIDPGATANTKGSWVEVTAATGINLQKLIIRMSAGANSALSGYNFLFDVAIGAMASEQIIIQDMVMSSISADDQISPEIFYMPCSVPAGSRLSVRAQCSGTDVLDRIFYAFLYGLG